MKIKLQYVAIFLVGTYAASIPAMANADWSIKLLGGADAIILDAAIGVSDINDSGQAVGVILSLVMLTVPFLSSQALMVLT